MQFTKIFFSKGDSLQKALLLDWQASRYSSPILDFVHFVFACTDGILRSSHYDELVNTYHRSLKDLLDNLGGNTESQFSLKALYQQLKKFGKFGIIYSTLIIPMASVRNEVLQKSDLASEVTTNDGSNQLQSLLKQLSKGDDNSKVRMRAALVDGINYGYI